jgi:hypothetical protein
MSTLLEQANRNFSLRKSDAHCPTLNDARLDLQIAPQRMLSDRMAQAVPGSALVGIDTIASHTVGSRDPLLVAERHSSTLQGAIWTWAQHDLQA